MQPIYAILDPTSGKRYRTFKCAECGRSEMTEYRNAKVSTASGVPSRIVAEIPQVSVFPLDNPGLI
jgi:hypothetical protein